MLARGAGQRKSRAGIKADRLIKMGRWKATPFGVLKISMGCGVGWCGCGVDAKPLLNSIVVEASCQTVCRPNAANNIVAPWAKWLMKHCVKHQLETNCSNDIPIIPAKPIGVRDP